MSTLGDVAHAFHSPLLLSALTNGTSFNISGDADDSDGIMLSNFDRQVFAEVMLMYAAPCAVAFIAGTLALFESRFHLGLLPSWLLRDWLGSALHGADTDREVLAHGSSALGAHPDADATFELYLAWMFPSAVFFVLLVPFSIIAFLVAGLLLLDRLFAVACAYLFFLAMLCTWTMLRWKFEGWELTTKVKWLGALVLATVAAFELYKVYYARPYTFIGLGVFCLACNMLAMIQLAYYTREFKHTEFDDYVDVPTSVVSHLEQQAVEAAAKAAAAVEAKRAEAEQKMMLMQRASKQLQEEEEKGSEATVDTAILSIAASPSGSGAAPARASTGPATATAGADSGEDVSLNLGGGLSGHLASQRHFQHKLSLPIALFRYARALAALAGYAVIIDFAGFGTIGYITAGAIIWLDVVILLWIHSDPSRTPLQACLLLSLVRFFMIIFGPEYYLVGHACLFIVMACFFVHHLIERFAPLSRLRHASDDEDEITPAGYAPIGKLPATAVKPEQGSTSKSSQAAAVRRQRRVQRMEAHLGVSRSGAQVFALVLLVLAFVFDTVLCYFISDARIPCGIYTSLPQAFVGFFGMFVFGVFALSKLTFRIYVNQQYKSKGWVLFLSFVQYVLILACGWAYWYFAREKNVPSLCIFLPPMVYFLIGLFSQWVKNDFHVILPSAHRNPPRASCWDAFLRCGFPGNDYFMVFGIAIEIGLIIALGFALSWYISPSWVGAMVSWVLVVLLTSITPMVEYFHTFEFSTNMLVMAFTSVVSFFIGLGLIFIIVLESEYGQAAFLLMLVGFLYPITISFTVGIAKWHDDEWVLSDFVVWTNFVSGMLLILMFFSIAMVFTPWWIGGGLMFVEIVVLMAIMLLPKIKELSPVWYKLICTVSVVLMFGFAISATLEDSSGFTAFTVLCAVCFLALLAVIYYAHRGSPYDSLSIHKHKVIIYSPHVFPIFEFDTMAKGKTNPLTEVNQRVWSVYAILAVCYVWGVFALFFQYPTTVGLCVSSLSLVGTLLFTHELTHRASVRNDQLAEAVDYLDEGSTQYFKVLNQCKWIATKNQLLNDTTLYISTKKNKLAADIGIQTDALVPGSLNFVAQQSIITHLHFVYAHQNWAVTKRKYAELDARLSKMSCCGLRRDMSIEVEGVRVSRRDAFRLADELFLDGAAFYRRSQLYNLNMQQELIKAVESIKHERLVDIVSMLRERGNMTVTVEHLKSLHPLHPELLQYDSQVDAWTEQRARIHAQHARIRAEKDADQRRRDALALVAIEHARKVKAERAAAELRQKQAEMEAAKQAALDEAARAAHAQAEELAAFERQQMEQLEAERLRQQREREEEERRKQMALDEIERQKRIAEKRREQKELADKQRAEAEAAMAAKEQAELSRLRRKAEARSRQLEHARLLAEKKAKLKSEAEMKRKMEELAAKHRAELEVARKQQEEEARKAKKLQEESAMLAALKAEAEERRLAHEREVEEMRRAMEEQEARMRAEKAKLDADRAAHEAEMAALAAAEQAARDRAAAQEQLERRRREEEEAKKEAERYEQEQRLMEIAAQEEENRAREREREEQRRKHQSDLEAAKMRKQHELEMKREAKKAEIAARNKKDMEKLEQHAKSDQCCTFKLTDQKLVFQGYWSCQTCGDANGGTCFCFQCAEACHKGHVLKREGEAACYCDCGHARATCLMMKTPAERKVLHDRTLVQASQSVAVGAPSHAAPADAEVDHPCKEILRQVRERGSGASWTDPDFGPDDSALFGGAEPLHPEWAGCKWARIKDICKGDPTVFLPPVDANDIRQGSLGNCWLLSAIAVLTQKPDALMGVFVTREYCPEGVYGLRFFKNGKVANVTVDDWLPISNNNAHARPGSGLDPLFSKAKDARAIWVMLLEKAYAKLHHSFQNIEGGWMDNALVELAGGVADRIRWTDEKTKAAIHDGSLFTMLLKYHEQGFLLGAGSPVGTSDSEADASPWGIVQSHAYSVLRLAAVDGLQLIQVRNPWGRKEWTGDWSDKSPLWTRRLKSKVHYEDREDGSFWMSWNDFCNSFDEMYVARFYSEQLWPSRGKVYGEWRGATAGGCVNHESVKNNVQYGLTILDAGPAEIAVSLLLEDVRGVEGKIVGDFPTAILEIYDHKGKPINQRERGQQLASSCDNLQEIFVECTVESNGSRTLTILPCLFEAGVETSYTLNWYCNKRAKLQQFQQADTQNMVVPTKNRY